MSDIPAEGTVAKPYRENPFGDRILEVHWSGSSIAVIELESINYSTDDSQVNGSALGFWIIERTKPADPFDGLVITVDPHVPPPLPVDVPIAKTVYADAAAWNPRKVSVIRSVVVRPASTRPGGPAAGFGETYFSTTGGAVPSGTFFSGDYTPDPSAMASGAFMSQALAAFAGFFGVSPTHIFTFVRAVDLEVYDAVTLEARELPVHVPAQTKNLTRRSVLINFAHVSNSVGISFAGNVTYPPIPLKATVRAYRTSTIFVLKADGSIAAFTNATLLVPAVPTWIAEQDVPINNPAQPDADGWLFLFRFDSRGRIV